MILHKSNQYEKLVNKSKSFDLNINKCVEMSEIVEGKEVFEKIVAPYKGKFVLIDIWGTSCVPCRKAMKDFDKEYEALSPYGVAFLFLANNSDDEVIKTVATDYNITGKDVHHYNLPDPQQRALEDYLKVTGYPTYILVDPSGQIVDTPVDARDLKSLEDVIKKHSLPTQSK